jgi:N-acetylglucosaminyldiphosphoundecaprenol N-acetyl-beta-D-mannosaminyltransferase
MERKPISRRQMSKMTAQTENEPALRCAEIVESILIVLGQREAADLLSDLVAPQRATTLAFCNAHAMNLAWDNALSADDFLAADIMLRDGKGMEMLFSSAGRSAGVNMNGTDFIPEILKHVRGSPIAIYGTTDHWLSEAVRRLIEGGHVVIDTCDGFREDGDYADRLEAVTVFPKIILLGMGMTKQERVARLLKCRFPDQGTTIICGGAIVDFIAGRYPRAPMALRRMGLEWAYRLFHEPTRLFRRYVVGNALFLRRRAAIVERLSETNGR